MSGVGAIAGMWLSVLVPTVAPVKPVDTPGWTVSPTTATVTKANIVVPLSAGTLHKFALKDFGRDGVDLYAQYDTPDGAIFGTIFVYPPTLANTGLTFLATDEAIRRRFGASTKVVEDHAIPVAGRPGTGRRVVYEGVDGGSKVSSAIFVRAGSWMVVVRVTGPASRREEILRDLDALLAGVRLPKGSEPLPSNVITVEGCPLNSSDPNAEIRLPKGGEALGIALSLQPNVGDETGQAVENPLRAVPQRMCLESSDTKNKIPLLTLKAVAAAPAVYAPRRYVLYGDAGQIVEILESRKEPGQFFALRHGIGTMYVVGKFQGLPSATQIWGLIAAPEDAPAVVVYRSRFLKGDGSDNFEINCNLTQEGCAKAKDSKK